MAQMWQRGFPVAEVEGFLREESMAGEHPKGVNPAVFKTRFGAFRYTDIPRQ